MNIEFELSVSHILAHWDTIKHEAQVACKNRAFPVSVSRGAYRPVTGNELSLCASTIMRRLRQDLLLSAAVCAAHPRGGSLPRGVIEHGGLLLVALSRRDGRHRDAPHLLPGPSWPWASGNGLGRWIGLLFQDA